jgi:hypothetical protein
MAWVYCSFHWVWYSTVISLFNRRLPIQLHQLSNLFVLFCVHQLSGHKPTERFSNCWIRQGIHEHIKYLNTSTRGLLSTVSLLVSGCNRSWGSSVNIVSDYKLDDRCSIPSRGKGFFLWPLCTDQVRGPPILLSSGYRLSLPRG